MVMTVLEAVVDRSQWGTLQSVYTDAIRKLDAGIAQTFLVQSRSDENTWRIMTIWESAEALNAMRQSGETPRGVLMFQAAGAQPSLSVYDVVLHGLHEGSAAQ